LREVRQRSLVVTTDVLYKAAVSIFRAGASTLLETKYGIYLDTETHGVITSYKIITIFHSVLAFSTQVLGFKPGRSRRIYKGEKILSTPSFGGEVKPSVPCRRFATFKRSVNGVEVVISAKLPDSILAHSSTFRC
jgi:hypothetical protein